MKGGWTPRAKFDDAQEALRTAEAQVESAQAQLRIAEDRLGYTVSALTVRAPSRRLVPMRARS